MSDRLINALKRPSLWEKTEALAQYYANRDGHNWYVFTLVKGGDKRPDHIQLSCTPPDRSRCFKLRTFAPIHHSFGGLRR